MNQTKIIAVAAAICACAAASFANAVTIPAGTTLIVSTVSHVTSQSVVGRSFEARLAQDVGVRGNVVLRAGARVFGRIAASRANPRRSAPLSLELASIEMNGRRIPVRTNSIEPHGPPQTARTARYGHTAGTTVVNPGTRMQFQLLQPLTL